MRTLLVLFACAGTAPAASFDLTLPPKAGEKFKSCLVRVWLPDDAKTIRAVIVRQHGCGRNGIDHADDLQWQALARKHSAALYGSHFVQDQQCSDWFDPKHGSERAFLEALRTVAEKGRHPELASAPWAIWGHSGGSMWACHMMNRHPARVVAVFARSQALTEYVPEAYRVPVIFNYGEGEKTGRFESVHKNSVKALELGTAAKACWVIAVDPKSSHDCRNSRQLAIRFFDRCLAERLGNDGLKPMEGVRGAFGWMPSRDVADAWSEYTKTGDVRDTTPPPAPTGVKAVAAAVGVTVTWAAAADLESGLRAFAIYRDGEKVGTVGSPKAGSNKAGDFQMWNYGDEPEPRAPAFSFDDPSGKLTSRYEVVAENHAGLTSKREGR